MNTITIFSAGDGGPNEVHQGGALSFHRDDVRSCRLVSLIVRLKVQHGHPANNRICLALTLCLAL